MSKKQFTRVAAIAVVSGLGASIASAQITIPTVPIGNIGNAPDPLTGNLYGSVVYAYNIGTYEVTNAQYAAFLNAVAATDTYSLYNTSMGGGIIRSGVAGSYTYATVSGRANNPVNYVTFWDATRFANWLHNGQPSGAQNNSTTESGAYSLSGNPLSASVVRNPSWRWAVTNEHEWYKAAYYQPAGQGGDTDDYWLYPISSNTLTTAQANYGNVIGTTRPVGSYAANFYGTFDMGGNVWEWNESVISGSFRGLRGGSLAYDIGILRATFRNFNSPTIEFNDTGFRVVTNQQTLSTNLQLLNTVASFAASRQINYTVVKNNQTIASGVITANTSSTNASITLPLGQTGAVTVVFDGSSFLRRVVACNLTGSSQSLGQVTLSNGDVDLTGEVDAVDIDLVIADFGSTAVGNSDVDVSGEVDAVDIDIVIGSFGDVDE